MRVRSSVATPGPGAKSLPHPRPVPFPPAGGDPRTGGCCCAEPSIWGSCISCKFREQVLCACKPTIKPGSWGDLGSIWGGGVYHQTHPKGVICGILMSFLPPPLLFQIYFIHCNASITLKKKKTPLEFEMPRVSYTIKYLHINEFCLLGNLFFYSSVCKF